MTLIVATPERIYVDTRLTIKDRIVDGMEETHEMEFSFDGLCKVMPTGVSTSEHGAIHFTVGFGDMRVFKLLNNLLKVTGLDSFMLAIPTLAKLFKPNQHATGLVWVDERGKVNSITYDANDLTHLCYHDEVVAFGHSAPIFNHIYAQGILTVEEAFKLVTHECDYASKGDYYVYDTGQRMCQRYNFDPPVFDQDISAIKRKLTTAYQQQAAIIKRGKNTPTSEPV